VAKIMIAYWLIKHYQESLFLKFENIVYKLTILSLVLYSIQLVAPTILYQILNSISLSGNLFPDIPYASNGLYTFHQKSLVEAFPRNAGFTWEPGPFASFIGLAIFVHIIRNRVRIKEKKRLGVFIVALITTQSTTGFLILLIIILWYAWAKYNSKIIRLISLPVASILVVLLFYNVPWLQEKVLVDSSQSIDEIISNARITGDSYAPGRLVGMQLRWEDFKNYPIAGFGGNIQLQFGYLSEGNVISAINGLGNIIGRYGAIGGIIFLISLFKLGLLLSEIHRFNGWLITPIIITIIGYSFGIIESPIVITFLLFPYFFSNQLINISE
jgi:hypothetical protein